MPIDQLADELKTAMLLPEDADSSTLVEMLKDKKRLVRRRGSRRFNQAMYRNKAEVKTFVKNARAGMYDAHPSFVGMGTIEKEGHRFDGFELQLFSNNAKHTKKHEDNWDNLLDVITHGEMYELNAKASTTGKDSFLYYKQRDDGKIDAVVASPRSENSKALAVVSAWKTSGKGIDEIIRRAEEVAKRKTASVQTPGGSPGYPSQQRGALTDTEAVENSIPTLGAESNILFQTAWHGSPHKFDTFSTEHIGSGEGAQVHGWGLYFAGSKEVSAGYRKKLAHRNGRGAMLVNGKRFTWVDVEGGVLWEDEHFRVLPDYENEHLTYLLIKLEKGHDEEYLKAMKQWLAEEDLTDEEKAILSRQIDEYENGDIRIENRDSFLR